MAELQRIVGLIQDEIDFLEKYRWNLKKTAISNNNKLTYEKKKSYKILDEVDRVTLEISNLEKQKAELLIKYNYGQ